MTEEQQLAIARMWRQRFSLKEIGAQLSLTKGQIAGVVWRLRKAGHDLRQRRPSPNVFITRIKPDELVKVLPDPPHAELVSESLQRLDRQVAKNKKARRVEKKIKQVRVVEEEDPPAPPPPPPPASIPDAHICRWILNDPRDLGGPQYCPAKALPAKPYCTDHQARAYATPPARRE